MVKPRGRASKRLTGVALGALVGYFMIVVDDEQGHGAEDLTERPVDGLGGAGLDVVARVDLAQGVEDDEGRLDLGGPLGEGVPGGVTGEAHVKGAYAFQPPVGVRRSEERRV